MVRQSPIQPALTVMAQAKTGTEWSHKLKIKQKKYQFYDCAYAGDIRLITVTN